MHNTERERVLALAGVFQSARLAQQLARQNRADEQAYAACIKSIFAADTDSAQAAFGGLEGITLGLHILRDKIAGNTRSEAYEVAKYVISLVQLVGKLGRQSAMVDAIARGIETARARFEKSQAVAGPGEISADLIEQLATLYTQTISTLRPRIIVAGEQGYLTQPRTATKVRAILLAGIRATFLWKQLGGNRRQLLLGRRRVAVKAGEILEEIESSASA